MSNEQSNKILLLLFGVLILAIFMDSQARRHYESMKSPRPEPSRIGEMERAKPGGDSEDSTDIQPTQHSQPYRPTIPVIRRSAREIFGGAGEGLPNIGNHPGINPIPLPAMTEHPGEQDLPFRESRRVVEHPEPSGSVADGKLDLYFIRFRRTRTDLVRVTRKMEGKSITLHQALELLQSGPLVKERGLLTAFDTRIPVHSLELREGTVVVDVGSAIESNGRRIVRDRLAQLHFTLRQFPEVKRVKILVNGVPREKIGSVKVSFPKKRRVLEFRSNP